MQHVKRSFTTPNGSLRYSISDGPGEKYELSLPQGSLHLPAAQDDPASPRLRSTMSAHVAQPAVSQFGSPSSL